MTDLIHLRCSSAPIAFRCGGSVRLGAVPINEASDAADVGTAGHEGLATLVRTGSVDWDGIGALARKHDVDEKELRVLLALGAKLWGQVRESFPHASAEVPLKHQLGSMTLTGHPDVLGTNGTVAYIGDWKLGRLDSAYREQLLGYCALVLLNFPQLTEARAGILWVREQEYEPHSMTRAGLYEWLQRVEDEIVQWDGVWRPGSHCAYCQRSHECGPANALARRDMAILMDQEPGQLEDVETIRALVRSQPDKAIALVKIARGIQKKADRVIAALKDEVVRDGDVVGEEERLTLQRSERRHLSVLQAFPVLQEQLDDAEMAEVIDISLSKAEELVAKKAGKGNGARAKRELQAKLDEVGAIHTTASANLVIRREA